MGELFPGFDILPFSLEELQKISLLSSSLEEVLFKGFYPPLCVRNIDQTEWVNNYIQTYVERGVRQLKQITDLSFFLKFLQLCAGRVGRILDIMVPEIRATC